MRLLAEHAPPVRPLNVPGHRGSTFSSTDTHFLYNVADACVLLPLPSNAAPATDDGTTFQFRELVVCHDLLHATKSSGSSLVALAALASGEVLRWSPLARRFAPLPCVKEGAADGSIVTLMRWCPLAEGAFITGHANGQLLLYDEHRAGRENGSDGASSSPEKESSSKGRRTIKVSATLRGGSSSSSSSSNGKEPTSASRQAPVSSWQVGTSGAAITALSFSGDGQLLAVGLADGALSLFDFSSECPLVRLHAYFGAVLTCAWSHDKRYLISGGQDDLIAVWDVTRRSLVSRGVGHSSWITSAAFTTSPPSSSRRPSKEDHDEEPSPPSSPGNPTSNNAPQASSYRVATCAVDCKMLLWEFDPTTLGGDEDGDGGGGSPEPPLTRDSSSGGGGGGRSAPFLSVPSIQPLYSEALHVQPICSLLMKPRMMMTADMGGVLKVWSLPQEEWLDG